jgi:hypothetical protein
MKRKRHSRRTSHATARRPTGTKRLHSKGSAAATRALSPQAIARLATEALALPSSYGETSLAVFPIQPYAVHACWDVTPETLEQGRRNLGAEADAAEAVLRFQGIRDGRAPDQPGPSLFDVRVDVGAGDWYVDLWRAGQTYVVELGLRTPSGRFQPLARSNRVETPRAEPAPVGASPAEDSTRERVPAGEIAGFPSSTEQPTQDGQAPGGEKRATGRPVGAASPAGSDVTGQSEAAFRAGISSRR